MAENSWNKRKTVCIDFDGVIHLDRAAKFVATEVTGTPVAGAIEWIHKTLQMYDVVILSSRATKNGVDNADAVNAIRGWLKNWSPPVLWITTYHPNSGGEKARVYGVEEVVVTGAKVPAMLYIDDRAFRFTGIFDNIPDPSDCNPWHRRR